MRFGGWIVCALACLISFTNLGQARLWDRDEPRNAQCAREMLESGNWIVPTFDGELRTHKPVLLYWCQILSYQTFGVNEWAARFPSALAGVLTALSILILARHFFAEDVAIWSGICGASMLLTVLANRAATPDALLLFTVTLAITLFAKFAYRPAGEGDGAHETDDLRALVPVWPKRWQWSLVYSACGLAVLAKGPVGLVLPIAVMGLTLLWTHRSSHTPRVVSQASPGFALRRRVYGFGLAIRNWTRITWQFGWRMRPILAVAIVLIIAGPWYAAVGIATDGVWLREFFFTHNVSRAVSTMEGHSGPPILFYIGALLAGTFPWSCFAIPIGLAIWKRSRSGSNIHPGFALAGSWITMFVVAFSLASTKLPSYVTPCHPAVALAAGWFVAMAIRGRTYHPRWNLAGYVCAAGIGGVLFFALAGPAADLIPTVRPVATAGIVFTVASILGITFARRHQPSLAMRSFVIGSLAVIWILHGFGPGAVDRGRADLDRLQQAFVAHPEARWVASGPVEPSWVFYSNGRVDRTQLRRGRGETNMVAGEISWSDHPGGESVPIFLDDQFLQVSAPVRQTPRLAGESSGRVQ